MTAPAEPQALLVQLLDPSHRADPTHCTGRYANRARCRCPNPTCMSSPASPTATRCCATSSCSDRLKSTVAQRAIAAGEEPRPFGTPGFLFLDPPDHTRLRKLVSKAFSPRVVKALEPDIVAMVDGLLDKVAAAGSFEVIADLAYPLPVAVICRLLGVPIEDEPQFSWARRCWPRAWTRSSRSPGSRMVSKSGWRRGSGCAGYLRDLLERRRAEPADDLMSGLISVEEAGDQLTESGSSPPATCC